MGGAAGSDGAGKVGAGTDVAATETGGVAGTVMLAGGAWSGAFEPDGGLLP